MNSLTFNFIKRAIIVPVAVTAAFVAILAFTLPGVVARSQNSSSSSETVQQMNYERVDYKKFSELKDNTYVGYISSSDFSLGTNVLMNSSKANCVSLSKDSTEPKNDGCLIIFGDNVKTQFKNLHLADTGDTVELELNGRNKYEYKIKKIIHNKTKEDISAYKKADSLIMCLSYNDFTNLGNSYLYTLYVAERI